MKDLVEDEIVISGISGRFPESANMNEFRDNLLKNINLVTVNERRFKPKIYGIPEGFGALKEIDKFDAEFFRVFPAQASRMDPQLRITLETTFEAMQDAGVNPYNERESRTGVFFGVCGSEASILWNAQASKVEGPTLTGCSHSMFANRISYAFDFNGPSCAFDTACSTSIVALEAAVSSIQAGKCDAAIVTASTLILTPHTTLQFQKLGMLAPDSACKSFDCTGNGYVRSEAVATIYLQKKSVAKRIYASVLHVKTNTDGFKEGGITFPSSVLQMELLRETYEEAGIYTDEVTYLECHGTGTAAGDNQELKSIAHTFMTSKSCRTIPLYVGSVKSNMGHSEAASGLCGIAKLVIAMQEGVIPANLHFNQPHYTMKAVRDGNMKIVDKNTTLIPGLVALNSFGFGGVNAHLILKPYTKNGNGEMTGECENIRRSRKTNANIPKLITMTGRTDEGLRSTLNAVGSHNDIHLNNLLNECHMSGIQGHAFRGFSIPEAAVLNVEYIDKGAGAGVYFVFNGIGSQWSGMGLHLMKLPVFAASIQSSAQTLLNRFNYDLMSILTSPELPTDDPTSCFVTIAAIQIALVDVLTHLGVRPQGFIGHSAGEMLCAYVDGCLSAQETITCAYLRGNSLGKSTKDAYGMAVVSASWSYVMRTVPTGVFPACHNGTESVTVSGPLVVLDEYVAQVKADRKIARQVNSCGVAFHSPYMDEASNFFLASLRDLIPAPKARSRNWISTSVPKQDWSLKEAKSASPDYFNNNFRSPVLFYEACQHIPVNATVIEIGPSGLLKGLIKRAAPTSKVIPLQSRDSKDGLLDFLKGLGNMFIAGVEIDVNKLYGDPEYPVPLGTPMLSPLIHWDHGTSWDVPVYGKNGEFTEVIFEVDMGKESEEYLFGHQLQGRALFPASGYLVLVWKAFAQKYQTNHASFPVIFENVKFSRVTVLRASGKFEFRVNVSDLSGMFEVKEGGAVVASGVVRCPSDIEEQTMNEEEFSDIQAGTNSEKDPLYSFERGDIYRQLRFAGYQYSGLFKGIRRRDLTASQLTMPLFGISGSYLVYEIRVTGQYFQLDWSDNWVAFLDNCLQTSLRIFEGNTQTKLPTVIRKLHITPKEFLDFVENHKLTIQNEGLFVLYDKVTDVIRCKGIEVNGFKTTAIGGSGKEPPPALSPHKFCPFLELESSSDCCPIVQCVTIIMENIKSSLVTTVPDIVEFTKNPEETSHALQISKLISEDFATPHINFSMFSEDCRPEVVEKFGKANISLYPIETINRTIDITEKKYDLIIIDNNRLFKLALDFVRKGGFLICKLPLGTYTRERVLEKLGDKFSLIVHRRTGTHDVFMAREDMRQDLKNIKVVQVSTVDLSWVPILRVMIIHQEAMIAEKQKPPLIYLTSIEDDTAGILGLTLCLRKEPFCQQIRCIFGRKIVSLDFDEPDDLLKDILERDLAITVVDFDGTLGSYVHNLLPTRAVTALKPNPNVFLGMESVGDLTTLRWIQGFPFGEFPTLANGFTPIRVMVAALNFKDIMLSSGNLQPEERPGLPFTVESPLGVEFAGVTKDGDRVMGFSDGQSLATDVLANIDCIWKIPEGCSFADAATIPVAYSTVYLALVMRGQIQTGDSILIHAGAGGVGLAAIRVALSFKCPVFTTVGSKDKLAFIRKTFPQIPESHIGFSRDTSFEAMILKSTKGRGVDLVLNSLFGDKLEASVRCLARHGRFLEIGKVDLVSNKALGMGLFLKDASYHGVMLDSLWDAKPQARIKLKELIQDGLDEGVIQALPSRIFKHEQVEPAFRYLAQGRHIGKVLVTFEDVNSIPALPRVYFDPLKTYIISGGLGGVGLEFINWMTTRYARKIVLTSRSGVTTAYQAEYIRAWERRGVTVKILQMDATDEENAKALVKESMALGPIGGFFNLAMFLAIGLMKFQTEEGFDYVIGAKLKLTKHLDTLTRLHCPELDHFVVFSSVASAFGFDGQANYGQANSGAERLMEQRQRDGLPGKAIQWGPIGEVGGWHDVYNADFNQKSFHGSGVQSIRSCLSSLDVLLEHECPVILSRRTMDPVLFSGGGAANLGVVDRIAHIMGHTNKKLNPNAKLTELGMDSVMSMEVKQILEQDFNLTLTAVEIRGSSLKKLEEMANNKIGVVCNQNNQAATAGLFQLNFVKTMNRSRFTFSECVFPVNDLAEKRVADAKVNGIDHLPNSQGTVFIINSLEGPDVLKLLGSLVNLPTYAMQMATDAPFGEVTTLTSYYFEKLKAVEPHGPYIIIGYSAGVFVGMELALRLEKLGELTKLMLLDMTPHRFRAIVEENFGPDRSTMDETDIMIMIMTQIFGLDRNFIEGMLRKEKTMEKRIEKICEVLLINSIFEEKIDVKAIQKGISKRGKVFLNMFDSYRPTGILEGKLILIKTTQNLISYDSDQFWGIDEFCKNTPVVRVFDSTHSYLLTEPSVREVASSIKSD